MNVLVNPSLGAKASAAQLLTSHSQPVGVGQLPSGRTLRRAVQQVREEADAWHDENWARLYDYLCELNTDEFFVDAQVDELGHFEGYFVGILAALKVLEAAGLDYFSVDACHIKHVMSKGLQLHLLVGRTGANKFVPVAFSLNLSETSASYSWLASCCKEMGFCKLATIEPGPFERVSVTFSDGFKGTDFFTRLFEHMHHARCAQHLCRSVRVAVTKTKKANSAVNAAFHDNQIMAVCKAASLELAPPPRRSWRQHHHTLFRCCSRWSRARILFWRCTRRRAFRASGMPRTTGREHKRRHPEDPMLASISWT